MCIRDRMKGLRLAASKGMGVVVMEPLLGGKLANPPADIFEIMSRNGYEGTPADLALRWLWNQPEVSVVLSGMSDMTQVKENIISAEKSGVGTINEKELKLVHE